MGLGLGLGPIGILAEIGRLLQAGENEKALDLYRDEIKGVQEEVQGPLFGALDELAGTTADVSEDVLRAEFDFFGGAGERFGTIANPLLESIGQRTELGISGAEGIAGGFADLEAEGRGLGRDLRASQRRRERRLLGMLAGLGSQERAEASRSFGALGRTEQARLAGLGLGGTTAASGVASGVARLRGRELGLIDERLRGEQLNLSERLSGETLNIQDITGQRGLGLGRDTLGAQADALQFSTDLRGQDIAGRSELGFAGLDFRDRMFMTLFGEQERLGLAPAEAALEAELGKKEFLFDDVIRQPPILVGQ